jgi:hypothetical protein
MPSPLALALMQQQPSMAPPQVSITPTDVAQIYKNSQDAALAAYKAQLDQGNSMWGDLTKLGTAGISAAGGPLIGALLPIAAPALSKATGNGK